MPKNQIIQTLDNTPKALIIGNTNNLGLHLSKHLLQKKVQVVLSTSLKNADQVLLNDCQSSPLFSLTHLKSLSPQNTFNYLFHLFKPTKKNLGHLGHTLNFAQNPKTRFVFISDTPPIRQTKLKRFDQAHQKIKTHLNKHKINARIIHLNHLYGPGVNHPPNHPLYHLFQNALKQDFTILGTHDLVIYPLYITDATDAVIKSIFASQTKGKIFEFGGEPISLLNFSLKLRSLLNPHFHDKSTHHPHITTIDSKTAGQILTTQEELRWKPSTSLEENIKKTIAWLEKTQPDIPPLFPHKKTTLTPPPSSSSKTNPSNILTLTQTTAPTPILDQPQAPLPSTNPTPPHKTQPKTFSLDPNTSPATNSILKNPTQSKPQPIKQTPPRFKHFYLYLIILTIFLTPILITITTIFLTNYHLTQIQTNLEIGDLDQLSQSAQKTEANFNRLKTQLNFSTPILKPLLGSKKHQQISDLIYIGQTGSQATNHAAQTLKSSATLFQYILGHSKGNIPMTLASTDTLLQQTYHDLSAVEAKINSNPNLTTTSFGVGDKLKKTHTLITQYKPYLFQTHQLINQSPQILGFSQKKTYMVLLQNNAELRPTGGFIGSFALITFDQGKLSDIHVEDVYTADGQLRGHVEPPPGVKQYLGEAGWFLRDVNWDPNFPSSASSAIWFLDKELGIQPDGVVGINLHVIKKLLEATGPISIPDYDETIASTNLFERVEYQVEINQFPGSTQKRDFLGKLTNSLIDQILQADQNLWVKIAPLLTQSADQNQILIYLTDQVAQKTIQSLGWSGQINQPSCHPKANTPNCINDYLGIFEANVGVNKANYFVTRKIDHQINIQEDGGVTITSTLTHQNTSPADNWPGGPYKNYLRFYTPAGSRFISAKINDKSLQTSDIDTSKEHNKTILGFLTTTPPLSTTTTSITYQLQDKLNLDQPLSYSLYLQKQSGTNNDPINLTLGYPANLKLLNSTQTPLPSSNPITSSLNFTQDHHLLFEFAK